MTWLGWLLWFWIPETWLHLLVVVLRGDSLLSQPLILDLRKRYPVLVHGLFAFFILFFRVPLWITSWFATWVWTSSWLISLLFKSFNSWFDHYFMASSWTAFARLTLIVWRFCWVLIKVDIQSFSRLISKFVLFKSRLLQLWQLVLWMMLKSGPHHWFEKQRLLLFFLFFFSLSF